MWHRLFAALRHGRSHRLAPADLSAGSPEAPEHVDSASDRIMLSLPQPSAPDEVTTRAALERVVEDWLNAPLVREQRRLLQQHAELLTHEAEALLHALMEKYVELPELVQELRDRLRLLDFVRRTGEHASAVIPAVYVNLEGGLALDVPQWLEELEGQLAHLFHLHGAHASAPQRAEFLRQAVARLRSEDGVADEVVAELNVRLWDALDDLLTATPSGEQEEGLACLRAALQVYTLDRYPAQYARCQLCAGNTYQERVSGNRRENFEVALACYNEALRVYQPEVFPELYAMAQNNLGNTYRNRIAGSRRDNVEEAIACYQRGLAIYTLDDFPDGYAMTQNNLGNTYLIRIMGQPRENLEAAIQCYQEALRVYTLDDAPRDYAMLQVGLGTVYRDRVEGSEVDNLEAAIRHYHAALQIYTAQSDPLHFAQVQMNLGGAYHERLAGDRRENLETSLACYARALEFYTLQAQPAEYAMTQKGIGNTLHDRLTGERQDNLKRAVDAYEAALTVYTPEAYPLEHRNVACALAATLWRDVASEAERRGQWADARQAYERAHAAYVSARRIQAELGWLETDEQGRARLRGSTRGARELYVRDAWCLWRLDDVREALVALEAGRAQALAEANALADVQAGRMCEEHALAFVAARAAYAEARLLQDRSVLRQARDHLIAVREAIRAHCDPELLPHEPTMAAIAQAAAPDQALVYLAATDRGGLAGVVVPESARTRDGRHEPQLVALPELTSEVVDTWLLRSDASGLILGGLQVALNREGRSILQTWAGLAGDTPHNEERERLSLPLETVLTQLPARLDTVRQALKRVLEACRTQAERMSRSGQVARAQRWQGRVATTLGSALQADWFGTLFDWAFQSAELDALLPDLGRMAVGPLRAVLDRLDLGLPAQRIALIPCGRLAALPLHAAPVPTTAVRDTVPFQESCVLSYQASAGALRAARTAAERLLPRGPVVMIGDPRPTTFPVLPWAHIEAQAIVRLAEQAQRMGSRVMVTTDATRDHVVEVLAQVRTAGSGAWIGIASHGHADATDPRKCFMLLAAQERLTAADLQRQRLLGGVRLFNASGCVTGLGDLETAPDELSSFAAGALQAGAVGVLATQWAVNDRAAAVLMLRFAHEWLEHVEGSPAVALRAAAAWLRHATRADIALLLQGALELGMSERALARAADVQTDATMTSARGLTPREVAEPYLLDSANTRDGAQHDLFVVADGPRLPQDTPETVPYADPIYWAAVVAYGA